MMPEADKLLLVAAHDLINVLEGMGLVPTIIGGVAVSLMTQSRHTDDVDAQILYDAEDAPILLDILVKNGFQPRFSGMAELAREARMITMRHEATDTVVDIALACMPFEIELQNRARVQSVAGMAIRLPTPEDMVILKAIASRPKDLEDIRNLALTYPNMDRKRIEHWVREYGDLMETSELWERTQALLDVSS
jgi:predicted nucleotidyltransferase